jgi:solute carrier family 25 (mitochondrial carrier protein), member 16
MDDVAKKRRSNPALCPTDENAIAPKRKAPEKRSLDYVWRSGLAGGLAGCAVRQNTFTDVKYRLTHAMDRQKV